MRLKERNEPGAAVKHLERNSGNMGNRGTKQHTSPVQEDLANNYRVSRFVS